MPPNSEIRCTANCLTCDSRFLHVFCNFHPDALARFEELGAHITRESNTVLFREGSPSANVFMVCSGQVKLSTLSEEGRSFVLKIASHGDLLGLSAVVTNAPYEATAETIGIAQLKVIPRPDFLKFIEVFGEASRHTASVLAEQHQAATYDVRRLGLSGSASAKLAHTLLELKHSANQRPSALTFPLLLTHEEMAEMTGTSRETVSRLMSQFKREGLIVINGVELTILRPDLLEHMAI